MFRYMNAFIISDRTYKLTLLLPAEARFGVKTMVIAADFSKGQPVFDEIEAKLKEIPVGILGASLGLPTCVTSL